MNQVEKEFEKDYCFAFILIPSFLHLFYFFHFYQLLFFAYFFSFFFKFLIIKLTALLLYDKKFMFFILVYLSFEKKICKIYFILSFHAGMSIDLLLLLIVVVSPSFLFFLNLIRLILMLFNLVLIYVVYMLT